MNSTVCDQEGDHFRLRVNEPYLIELAAEDSIPCLLSNFQGLHLWFDIERYSAVTWNLNIFFHGWVKVARSISIPEEGDMTKFDGLTVKQRTFHMCIGDWVSVLRSCMGVCENGV